MFAASTALISREFRSELPRRQLRLRHRHNGVGAKERSMTKPIKKILYATDYSKASGRALDEAVNLATRYDAELLVLHVIEPVTTYVTGEDFGSAGLYMKLEDATKREAEVSMQKLMGKLQKSKVRAKSLLLKGTPHDQIVKAAKSRNADMIVIGTHGRTGLSKLFMGSVAGKVVSTAIDVVSTLVCWNKFPPTIMAMPNSPNARLNAAITAKIIDHIVSCIIVKFVLMFDAPSVLARSFI